MRFYGYGRALDRRFAHCTHVHPKTATCNGKLQRVGRVAWAYFQINPLFFYEQVCAPACNKTLRYSCRIVRTIALARACVRCKIIHIIFARISGARIPRRRLCSITVWSIFSCNEHVRHRAGGRENTMPHWWRPARALRSRGKRKAREEIDDEPVDPRGGSEK